MANVNGQIWLYDWLPLLYNMLYLLWLKLNITDAKQPIVRVMECYTEWKKNKTKLAKNGTEADVDNFQDNKEYAA